MENNLAQSGQHDNWVLRRAAGGGSFKFSNLDPIHPLSRPKKNYCKETERRKTMTQ